MSNLTNIQKALKAPKNQFNAFGKYHYRSCEDILEALKPLIPDDCSLAISDEIIMIGSRYYVKAIVVFRDSDVVYTSMAYAREEENKKGMDGAQVTGSASSYARKYALNGLFLIDDTKDSDATNKHESESKKEEKKKDDVTVNTEPLYINETQKLTLQTLITQKGVDEKKFLDFMGADKLEHILADEFTKAEQALQNKKKAA